MRNLVTLFVLLLLLAQNITAQTIHAVKDGDWDDPDTWNIGGGVIPTATDDVEINGFDVLIDEAVGNVTIKSLHLGNDLESTDTRLLIDGVVDVTITNTLIAELEDVDNGIELKLANGAKLQVNQNVEFSRSADNNRNKKLKLRIEHNSEMTVDQNFTFNYKSSKSDESHKEFHLSHSAKLRVKGITSFFMNGGADFYLDASDSSEIILENGLYVSKSAGVDFNIEIENKLDITGDFSITHSGGTGNVFVNAINNNANISISGNLSLTSSANSAIRVAASNDFGILDVRGNINMNATVDNMISLELLNASELFLGGNVYRSNNFGDFQMSDNALLVYNGTSPQVITSRTEPGAGNGVFDAKNVELDNTAGFNLTDTLFIDKEMELTKGIVRSTASSPIVISDQVEITGGSKTAYISGPVIKRGRSAASFVFPVGNDEKYAPITLGRITDSEAEYTAEFRGDPPPFGVFESGIQGISTQEYWILRQSTDKEALPVTLHWDDAAESGISDTTNLIVVGRDPSVGDWENYGKSFATGGIGAGTSGSIMSAKGDPPPFGVFEFTFGTTTTSGNALPVELSRFNAIKEDTEVQLHWETASELNTRHFEIERSLDGMTYQLTGIISAFGDTHDTQNYTFRDQDPAFGENYYRLKIVDNDGTYEYSPVKVVSYSLVSFLTVLPNPIGNVLRIAGPIESSEEVLLEVFDMNGRLIYIGIFHFENGELHIDSDVLNANTSGTYYLRISGATESRSLKFMKLE